MESSQICLTQVVPTLPPRIDGLGDYALNLARQLRQDFAIETQFIVGNPHWNGEDELEGFPCWRVSQRSGKGLYSILPQNTPILLHYSGYGYAQRGCPRWLISGLEPWRQNSQHPLITMFHEVYTYDCGPPWTSSFWLSPLQKNLAIGLLKLSDRILTSKQRYANLLHQLSRGQHQNIPTFPVFSTIGEPDSFLPWEQRDRHLIVFGHPNTRTWPYQHHLPHLERTCQTLGIETIYDIGIPTGLRPVAIAGVPVVELGVTPGKEISQRMRRAIAGFLSFPPPEYLAKSTIFAAYCAHQLLPVLAVPSSLPVDGLEAGRHYWTADDKMGQFSGEVGAAIAHRAYTWYYHHRLAVQTRFIADLIVESPSI